MIMLENEYSGGMAPIIPTEEQVRRAIVRLDSSKQGRLAREEAEAGMEFREIINTYDLSFQETQAVGIIRAWVRERSGLPVVE